MMVRQERSNLSWSAFAWNSKCGDGRAHEWKPTSKGRNEHCYKCKKCGAQTVQKLVRL